MPVPKRIGQYLMKRQIGKGSFASVWWAEHSLTHNRVAIKVVENSSLKDEGAKTRFVRETNLIKKMDHPFVCKLFQILEDEDNTYLVMEYCQNGNLLDFVNTRGRLAETQARRYFSQLLSALEYIHDQRHVAHRDLKAENVLLDSNYNIRLIDFGLSNIYTDEAPNLSTACGSPAYAAPEMVKGFTYTKEADIWSAGVLLYAMVVGQLPFDDDVMQKLLQKIAFTEPIYPPFLSPQLTDFLKKLLTKDPAIRATIPKLKLHPWFSQSEYSNLLRIQFYTDETWLTTGIDKEIVLKIQSMGVDTSKLANDLLCDEYNDTTALYNILRREHITAKIQEMMNGFNTLKQSANRQDCQSLQSLSKTSGPLTIHTPSTHHVPHPIQTSPLTPHRISSKAIQPPSPNLSLAGNRNLSRPSVVPSVNQKPKTTKLDHTTRNSVGTTSGTALVTRRRTNSFCAPKH